MNGVDEFARILDSRFDQSKPEVIWVEAVSVDWERKEMEGKGLVDDLALFQISLGSGSVNIKPAVGSMCIVALLDGNQTSAKLIDASEIELIEFIAGETVVVIEKGGVSISRNDESLKGVLNDWIDEVSKIVVVQGTTINVAKMTAIKQRLNNILKT